MNILYISSYPKKYFEEVVNSSKILSSQPSQKFNNLLVEGFQRNGVEISVLLTFNHIKLETKDFYIKKELIVENGINYHFLSAINVKFISRIYSYLVIKKFLVKWKNENPQGVIVIDCLKPYSDIICKCSKGSKIVVIVTDFLEHLVQRNGILNKIKNFYHFRQFQYSIDCATHFIFLTKQMNLKLNVKNKPYCIIEGLVDSNNIEMGNEFHKKERNICLYSGALNKNLGIDNLVRAFTDDRLKDYELHLYGSGDYTSEIIQLANINNNIKYFGNIDNKVVIQMQIEATVLINPRPTIEEFTKYSFPSKIVEYMVSGTPVITTKLKGMPDEYFDYIYPLEDFSSEGIIDCIKNVLQKPKIELEEKGQKAKTFVLEWKNNILQTRKIIDLIKSNLR